MTPVLPLVARDMGAGVSLAATIAGLPAFGQLIGDLPAGALAARLGERRALLLAATVDTAAMVLAFAAHSLWLLAVAVFVDGISGSVFNLARHTWMTVAIPPRYRARALSGLGGIFRVGLFVGPFVTAALVAVFSLQSVFLFAAATGAAAGLLTLTMPDLVEPEPAPGAEPTPGTATLWQVVRRHRKVLATVGIGVLLVSVARASRQSILPLWSQAQHLHPSAISVVFGIAAGLELLLVYPGGAIMDRFGRAFVSVPAVMLIGVGLALLPLTHTAVTICLVACLMAVGNGLSSGLVLTTGSDAAPAVGRPHFLAAWRFLADTGGLLGPLAVSGLAALASLVLSCFGLAGVCVLGAGWLAAWMPRTRGPRRSRAH